ncbi:MAG TPA: heme exporter protein CcmD [Burkholderiales bacterium]|nr:heme exporter protein CcmD [Burkholderiales bacterium]
MSEFFYMGGYGLYVWGSYGVTFALLAIELAVLWKRTQKR